MSLLRIHLAPQKTLQITNKINVSICERKSDVQRLNVIVPGYIKILRQHHYLLVLRSRLLLNQYG